MANIYSTFTMHQILFQALGTYYLIYSSQVYKVGTIILFIL